MAILYNCIYFLAALIYIPLYLIRGKFHKGFSQRVGFLPKNIVTDKPIWVHAVSVGEAMAVTGLVDELRRAYPGRQLVISTVTPTGNTIAKKIVAAGDVLLYLPLDVSFIVRRVIDRINPALFIIAETEIWPNLISYVSSKGIPIVTVNGRVSDSSFRGYARIRGIVGPILRKIHFFCVQTQRDKDRLCALGVEPAKVEVTGNMKFDALMYQKNGYSAQDGRRQMLGLTQSDKILVAGSTHRGEEEIVVTAYKRVLSDLPQTVLVVVPRHPERAAAVAELIRGAGFRPQLISLMGKEKSVGVKTHNQEGVVYILDTVGELLSYYAAADVVFVGGSLVRTGGHNILEPALFGKPILTGPHLFNFRDIADLFSRSNAAVVVRDEEDLYRQVLGFLEDPRRARDIGARAQALVAEQRGATIRNINCIQKKIILCKESGAV